MRVWADVYSPDGAARLGNGPITTVRSASVTRALDGVGSVSITVPGTDERALALLQNKRRIRVFVEHAGTTRELGRGVIDELHTQDSSGGWSLTGKGPDELIALKNKNSLLARLYNNQPIATVLSALTGLAGWTASVTATGNVSVRLDGETVLKALQIIVEQQGLHLRLGEAASTVEVGAFGAASGLRCVHVEHAEADVYANDDVLLIDRLSLEQDSTDLCNWLLPIGAGEGEAALTLKYSTRTTPYTIQTLTGPDGRTLYYLSDSASIVTYGQVERVGAFKNIGPLSNTDADLTNAANALYDAAAAYLARHKDKLDVYSLSVRKVRRTVRPGDKVHVRYKGLVYRDGQAVSYRDVNADMWVLECTERVGVEGLALDLKVATVDRYEQDAASVIIGALDAIEIKNLKVQPYPSTRSYVYYEELDATHSIKLPIRFTDSTLTLQRCAIRVSTRPFRSTAAGASSGGGATAAAGGDHNHRVLALTSVVGFPATSPRPYLGRFSDGGAYLYVKIETSSDNDLWTESSSGSHTHTTPNHSHAQQYGIQDDSATPVSISILLDGVDLTSALGGPFAPSGGNVTFDLNPAVITNALVGGTLRSEHTLEIKCASSQGRCVVQVEIYETVQSIAV